MENKSAPPAQRTPWLVRTLAIAMSLFQLYTGLFQLTAMNQRVTHVTLALVLMVGSGLMVRSFMHLKAVDPGFEASPDILTLSFGLPLSQYPDGPAAAALTASLTASTVTSLLNCTVRSVIEPTRKSAASSCFSASCRATAIILGEMSRPCTMQPGYRAAMRSAVR